MLIIIGRGRSIKYQGERIFFVASHVLEQVVNEILCVCQTIIMVLNGRKFSSGKLVKSKLSPEFS